MSGVANVPVSLIKDSAVALRGVNKQAESYLQLVESIRGVGVLNSITVRQDGDEYILVDGLQRLNASRDAGRETIPANVIVCDDEVELLNAQIIANIHKIETKPVEYSKQLLRILAASPMMTTRQLAGKLATSDAWINNRLGLVKLEPSIGELVDTGKINLSNAYALAKLPVEEQGNYIDRAMVDGPQTFVPTVHARVKELRDAKNQGRTAGASEFIPIPHMRKLSELKDELDGGKNGPRICNNENAVSALDGWCAAIKFCLNMDGESVAAQKAKDEERKAKIKAEAERRKTEREEQKKKEAASKAADLQSL